MKISSKQGLSSVVTPKNEIASPELRKKIKTGKIKYKLSSNKTTVREGEQFTLSLKTDEKTFPIGTKIPYTITGITSADVDNNSLTGNFIIGSTKRITYKVTKDNIQPETETITVALNEFPTGINGTGSVSIQLSDQLPTYTLLRSGQFHNAGNTITMTLKTLGVANSTSIAYAITGFDLNDLSGESSLTGTMIVTNSSASKTLTVIDDYDPIIEGYNDLTFALTGLGTSGTNYETPSVISQSVKIKEKVTWELSSNQTALEGSTVTFNLATKNIPNGKKFNYEVTGVTTNDFVGVPGVDWSVDNTVDITPNNSSDEVFLTYGGGKFMAATTDKIWSSIDGTSWTHVHTPTQSHTGITYGNNLHYDGTNWWYGNAKCIDMSSDGGTTWTNKQDLTPTTYSYADTIHSDGNGRVYFAGFGFNYTDDNGVSFNNSFPIMYFMFTHSTIGGSSSGVTLRSITTATQNSVDYVAAVGHDGSYNKLSKFTPGMIAYSTDNAVSWSKVGGSLGLCFGGNPLGFGFSPEDIVYADGIWVVVGIRTSGDTDLGDPHVSTWDRGQIYTSTSISNSSWTKIVDDANYGPFYRVLYQHNRLIALGKRVILISDDKGTTWTVIENNNIIPADTYVIGGYYDGTNLYMSGTNGWIGKVKLTDATPSLTGSFTIDNNAATTSFNLKDKDTIESESMTLTITTNDVGGYYTKASGSDEYNNVISKTVVITDAGDGPKLVLSSSSNTIVQDGSPTTITLDKDDYPAGSSIVWRAYGTSFFDLEQGGDFGYFTTSNAITNITLNSPVELTISGYNVLNRGYKYPNDGAQIQISDVLGTTELNGNTYYMKRLSPYGGIEPATLSIALYSDAGLTSPVDGSSFTAYTSGGWIVNDTLTTTFEAGPYTGPGPVADQKIVLYIGGNLDSNGNITGFPVTIDQTCVTTITLQGSDS